jgi:hypothetical protein
LLESLGSKLAILGPPRIVTEVPETLEPACELFKACGYVTEAVLTDYVWTSGSNEVQKVSNWLVIPVTIDDLAANGLLENPHPQVCWQRSVETLTARKDEIEGLAVASDERIEAYLLYSKEREIVALRPLVEDGEARLRQLLGRLRARGGGAFRFPRVHPEELSEECLETLGFCPVGRHFLYAATLRQRSGSP